MGNYGIDAEEEALFQSYGYEVYYVQSPSTISHANSPDLINHNIININESSKINYSSSRGSSHSFTNLNGKKISFDLQSHGEAAANAMEIGDNRPECMMMRDNVDDYEGDSYFGTGLQSWKKYFSFGYSSSFSWICLQISWRFVVSLIAALLVFYLAAKPPAPIPSVKIARIRQFVLAEGVDGTGVSTKMLTCNFSIDLVIDNESKMFGLHLHPPAISMSFGKLPFVVSRVIHIFSNIGTHPWLHHYLHYWSS